MDRRPKILVIDDDPDIVLEISRVLNSKAYDVVVAYDGEEGVKKAQTEKPDLILLDILMPVMDGFNAAARFHADPVIGKIPILAVTSFSESLGMPFEFDVSETVRKPIKPKDLLEVVGKHLTRLGF